MTPRPLALWLSSAVLASLGAVPAQSVSATTTAAMTASASSGTFAHNVSLPAGPLIQPALSAFVTGPGAAGASGGLTWTNFATPNRMVSFLTFQAVVNGPAAGAATGQANDVVVFYSLPQPTMVRIEMSHSLSAPIGTPMPRMRVDLNNDGAFELTETSLMPFAASYVVLGPTPTPVRLQVDAALNVPGDMLAYVHVEVLPGQQTVATNVLSGCGAQHEARPRFDGGVDLIFFHSMFLPEVGVVGLGVQPLLLNMIGASPCLLLPTPDLLLLNQSLTLPLPPAVRPVTLWSQNVALTLTPGVLLTSDAFRIDAP